MAKTLYRKYRPQLFSEVVGQNHVKLTLQSEIQSGKISHAYLFSGPHGVGKTTLARILTKALNCRQLSANEPCNQCVSCLEINEGRSLDMIEIDAASNRGINEIRELREQVKFVPLKEKFKVFIIDEVHMLTTEAFNALLKTLEEPPAHAVFVLATTEMHKLPETIISRCQHFDFKKVPADLIQKHLAEIAAKEEIKVSDKVLESISRHSGGFLRDAVSLLGQILTLGDKEISDEEAELVIPRSQAKEIMVFLEGLFKGQVAVALKFIQNYMEQGGNIEVFTKELIEYLRKILLAKATNDYQELLWDLNKKTLAELGGLTQNLKTEEVAKILEYILQASQEMKNSEIVQLPLEVAVVKICQLKERFSGSNDDGPKEPPAITGPSSDDKNTITPDAPTSNFASTADFTLSLEEIKVSWVRIINDLKSFNHSLAGFVREGLPLRLEGKNLIVGFRFAFHWERVKDLKNKRIFEEVLKNIFNQEISVHGEVDSSLDEKLKVFTAESGQKVPSMIESVLETLGGEVVN